MDRPQLLGGEGDQIELAVVSALRAREGVGFNVADIPARDDGRDEEGGEQGEGGATQRER